MNTQRIMAYTGAMLVLGGLSYALLGQRTRGRAAGPEARSHGPAVRPAGPEAMAHPPREWEIVDEQSDASFPASDPPANY